MARVDMNELAKAASAYEVSSEGEPDTMKAQTVETDELRRRHAQLNGRYHMLLNCFEQYIEMFDRWLAERT